MEKEKKEIIKAREREARLAGKRFYCRALSGDSNYNISINCDMTVSCCCADHDGSGILGDLSVNSLKEIFEGPTATRMRRMLSRGKIPIFICTHCSELNLVDKKNAGHFARNYRMPENGIMVENTVNCDVNCLHCKREIVLNTRRKRNLSLEEVKKISLLIKEHNIKMVYYFKQGESLLSPNFYDEVRIIRSDNPDVNLIISTNGLSLDTDLKRKACMMFDFVIFSIHGPDDEILRKYQTYGSFKASYANMKELIKYRNLHGFRKPGIEWKYVLFTWNDTQDMINRAIQLGREADVDLIDFVPGEYPFECITKRYFEDDFFKTLGYNAFGNRRRVIISHNGYSR